MAATVLFTGGNGFIGSSLASFLFNRGYEIVLYTQNPKLVPRDYRVITNLQDIEKLPMLPALNANCNTNHTIIMHFVNKIRMR